MNYWGSDLIMRIGAAFIALLAAVSPAAAIAAPGYAYGPWSMTVYAGPSTNSFFSHIFQGHFRVNGGMGGVAGDVRLWSLGDGWSISGEGQITQFLGVHDYTTGALGLGIRYDHYPWSIGLYSGPSYATDPPREQYFHGKALLNYVGVEAAYGIPHSQGWDVALRLYHRSGAWGLYSPDADEGTMLGIGIRKRF